MHLKQSPVKFESRWRRIVLGDFPERCPGRAGPHSRTGNSFRREFCGPLGVPIIFGCAVWAYHTGPCHDNPLGHQGGAPWDSYGECTLEFPWNRRWWLEPETKTRACDREWGSGDGAAGPECLRERGFSRDPFGLGSLNSTRPRQSTHRCSARSPVFSRRKKKKREKAHFLSGAPASPPLTLLVIGNIIARGKIRSLEEVLGTEKNFLSFDAGNSGGSSFSLIDIPIVVSVNGTRQNHEPTAMLAWIFSTPAGKRPNFFPRGGAWAKYFGRVYGLWRRGRFILEGNEL